MKHSPCLLMLTMLVWSVGAQAQLYKWVGPDGKVNYTDTPPPASVKQVEKKAAQSGGSAYTGLPYELAELAKSHPVTLFSGPQCSPCDSGRQLLNARGIPFTEKTVASNEDIEQLKKAGGDSLPLVLIGRNKQVGFQKNAWDAALTAAGYPESSKLPKSFSNPKAEPAAPKPVVAAPAEKPAQDADTPPRAADTAPMPPSGNAPPGFRF